MLFFSALLNSFEENCVNVLTCLRDCLKAPVTNSTIRESLKTHPHYPSLLSISDSLNQWNIETLSVNSSIEQLPQLPLPFIAHIRNEKGNEYFIVVKEIKDNEILVSGTVERKWRTINADKFKEQWTGVVLLADPLEHAGESEYKKKRRVELAKKIITRLAICTIIAWCLLTVILFFYKAGLYALPQAVLIATKMFGVYIGCLLLWYEIDHNNPALRHVCKISRKTDCNAILRSPAATISGLISWSEIGFVYFAGGLIILLTSTISSPMLQVLFWLHILAAPYIVFSIYYQWKIARQWCRLCLATQAILFIELSLTIAWKMNIGIPFDPFNLSDFGTLILAFLVPLLSWFLLKPNLLKARQSTKTERELATIKHNTDMFEKLLKVQKPVTPGTVGLGITLGNPKAKTRIIKVCNPYCGPCSKSHAVIENLLHQHPDIHVQIIFVARNDEKDARSAPVKHFMALAEQGDKALLMQALGSWYGAKNKNYIQFSTHYELQTDLATQGGKLQAMNDWCKKAEITFTPVFFINDYRMPEIYSVDDLPYLIGRISV